MGFAAVVFDMDGLLLDSETVALATFGEACREVGFEFNTSVYYRCIGVDGKRARQILAEGHGKDFPLEAVYEIWRKKMKQATAEKPMPLKPGAISLLSLLESKGIEKAVVTSTDTAMARHELDLAGVSQYFSFILGGDQVAAGKPHPEIYLKACDRLEESPSRCLALEDSDNGVRAAFGAGLNVVQVIDLVQPSAEVRALGHRIVNSLSEVEEMLRGNNTNTTNAKYYQSRVPEDERHKG